MKKPFAGFGATVENLATAGERVAATFSSASVIMISTAVVAVVALVVALVAVMK